MNSAYHQEVVNLFGQDIKKYYFIISDLIRNNYSGEHFKVYGEFEDNKLQSILLNNFGNVTYYSNIDRNIEAYKDIMKELSINKLSGPSKLVEKLIPFVNVQSEGLSYMGFVEKVVLKRKYEDLPIRFITTEEEIGMQYDLLMSTEEYSGILPDNREAYINEQKKSLNANSRTAYLLVDGKMVSSCSTVAEHDKSVIVIGVVTNPASRNKGYGSEVLTGLFESLLKEGKYPYLFYNNPAARRVYKKIGMEEVCEWRVVFTK